jgi:hypothetical protein
MWSFNCFANEKYPAIKIATNIWLLWTSGCCSQPDVHPLSLPLSPKKTDEKGL